MFRPGLQAGFAGGIPVKSTRKMLGRRRAVEQEPDMYKAPSRLQNLLRSSDARNRWLLVALIAALPCLNLLAFSWGAGNTALIQDQWHFMPMIRDYFAGQLHAYSLWETHSQHRTPGYKLLFLADAAFFGLNMRLEIMLGFAALTGSALLLMRRFQDTLPANTSSGVALLGLLAIALTGFNLNQWADLVYALTAFGGYAGILCFVWLWLTLDTLLRSSASRWQAAYLSLALAFTLTVFAAGTGPALIASLLLVPVGIMLIERRVDKQQLMLLAWLAFCSLICELVYWRTGGMAPLGPVSGSFISVLLHDPRSVAEYLLLAYASSVIPADAMAKHFDGLGQAIDLLAGTCIICLYAACGFLYLRMRMWKQSYLPAFLMAFSTLLILSTLMVRLPSTGVGASEAPRYVLYSQMGFIGCVWILYHGFSRRNPAHATAWRKLINPAACFTVIAVLYVLGLGALWSYYPSTVNNRERAAQEVLTGGLKHPDQICPDLKLCDEGRTTLARYGLNVFSAAPARDADKNPRP